MNKTNKTKAEVFHFDLYGKRDEKYNFLNDNSIGNIEWNELKPDEPNFFFVQKDFSAESNYTGFSLGELFISASTGVETGNDDKFIKYNIEDYTNEKTEDFVHDRIKKITYRPFDVRYCYYDNVVLRRAAYKNIKHFLNENIGLAFPRQSTNSEWSHIQIIRNLFDNRAHYSNKGRSLICPLYLYSNSNDQHDLEQRTERTPNLNMEIVQQIADKLSLTFTNEPFDYAQGATRATFAPIDILDYIYAVLHSPTYREKYKEFLKIDFPRVPYPKNADTFWQLVKLGGELRQIHLLESPVVENYITQYPIDGNNVVGKIRFDFAQYEKKGKVYINETQYFDNVPEVAWSFFIGGYQPAQKWLKDRKGRKLEFDDIHHYQKIIVALSETSKLMAEINRIGIE